MTLELAAPGFRQNTHSNVHNLIQANPMIINDELQLMSRFGLKYIKPDLHLATLFEDGSSILTYHDLDKTCASLARISPRDAEAYRAHVEKSRAILPMFVSGLFAPPVPFGTFMGLLEQSREGRALIGVMNKSAFDIIDEMFESDLLKIHFMKYSSESMAGPEEKGTGLIFSMLVGFVHAYHGGFPEGGSGRLSEALAACIEHHGGEIRTSTHVSKVLIESGHAVGVVLDGGETIRARRAVVGCFHPHLLGNYIEGLDEDIAADARAVQPGAYSGFAVNIALETAPRYPALAGELDPLLVELLPSDMQVFREEFDELRYGRLPQNISMVRSNQSQFDKTVAPPGKAVLNLYQFAPYSLADGGPEKWDDIKESVADKMVEDYRRFAENVEPDKIIGRHVASPLDMERTNISFQKGDISGIGRYLYQFLGRRPTPELSQYNVPGIESLYLAGPFMHPGGGVIGGGRATAGKIMDDLNINFDRVIAS